MSDDDTYENEASTEPADADDLTAAGEPASEPADSSDDVENASAGDGELDDEPEDDAASQSQPSDALAAIRTLGRNVANPANLERLGELHVHTETRTYTLVLDADAAARTLYAYRASQPWNPELGDDLRAHTSLVDSAWAVIDFSTVIAMMWVPAVSSRSSQRMAVDPAIA